MSKGETVKPVNTESEQKCSHCNFHYTTFYRLDSECDDEAVCGYCFVDWLNETNATITINA